MAPSSIQESLLKRRPVIWPMKIWSLLSRGLSSKPGDRVRRHDFDDVRSDIP